MPTNKLHHGCTFIGQFPERQTKSGFLVVVIMPFQSFSFAHRMNVNLQCRRRDYATN